MSGDCLCLFPATIVFGTVRKIKLSFPAGSRTPVGNGGLSHLCFVQLESWCATYVVYLVELLSAPTRSMCKASLAAAHVNAPYMVQAHRLQMVGRQVRQHHEAV